MTGPRYTDVIRALPASVPFIGPEALERGRGRPFRARIGANENVFGPSPDAVKAMERAAPEIWKYGDSDSFELRQALAGDHGIAPEAIVVGEGIDALLGHLVRLLIAPGDAVVTSAGAYPTFNFHVAAVGGTLHIVPYRDDAEDPAALIQKAAEVDAKLLYLANPDNPMGSWHDAATILKACDALPDGCLMLLDEAYVEFAPEGTAPVLDPDDQRVIRMRTFSKAYGMAGARIGYAVGHPDLIGAFDKVRNHFGVNRIAQAGALAALRDGDYLTDVIARVADARRRISRIAEDNGLRALSSATNFVAVDCGRDGDFARAVVAALAARDIFVRMPFVAPQDRCIRVSAGTEADLDAFAAALPDALAEAQDAAQT